MPDCDCNDCGGACCRSLTIPLGNPATIADNLEWLLIRGAVETGPDGRRLWRIPAACRHLSDDGRCRIYDRRPRDCRQYAVGGQSCLAARRAVPTGRQAAGLGET